MPSTLISIPPVDLTRVSALKSAFRLRYGNFEGIKFFPPLQSKDSTTSDESVWTIQNNQICQMVCQWMDQWRPWQQKTLVCDIANRCTLSQLEILSTTLEPLKQRPKDYRSKLMDHFTKVNKKLKKKSRTSFKSYKIKTPDIKSNKSINVSLRHSKHDGPSARENTSESLKIKKENRKTSRKEKKLSINLEKDNREKVNIFHNQSKQEKVISIGNLQFSTKEKSNQIEANKDLIPTTGVNEQEKPISVDHYASLLSASIILSALTDMVAISEPNVDYSNKLSSNIHKGIDKGLTNRDSPSPIHSLNNVDNTASSSLTEMSTKDFEKTKAQNTRNTASNDTFSNLSTLTETAPITVANQNNQSETQNLDATDTPSQGCAEFLEGALSFKSDKAQKMDSDQRGSSSQYRYQTFSASASIAEYFDERKVSFLGPKEYASRQMSLDKQLRIGSLPVSFQKFYKNSKWWSPDLQPVMSSRQISKKMLAFNFRDQMQTIWKWFDQWESPARMAFMKELFLVSSPEVLNTLINHIQQRLNTMKDVNSLSDKLLLYIFSFLEPNQIMQASKVSRKWRYLCARDDLWILKCLELGEREGITNMPELIQNANQNAMGVDWILAYFQLKEILPTIRHNLTGAKREPSLNAIQKRFTVSVVKRCDQQQDKKKGKIKINPRIEFKEPQQKEIESERYTEFPPVITEGTKGDQSVHGSQSLSVNAAIPKPQWTQGPQRTMSLRRPNLADPFEDPSDKAVTSDQWTQGLQITRSLRRPNLADPSQDPSDKAGTSDQWTQGPQKTRSLRRSNLVDPSEVQSDKAVTSDQWTRGPQRTRSLRRPNLVDPSEDQSDKAVTSDQWTQGPQRTRSLRRPNLVDPSEDQSDKAVTSDQWTRGPQRTRSLRRPNLVDPSEDQSDKAVTSDQWTRGPQRTRSLRRPNLVDPSEHQSDKAVTSDQWTRGPQRTRSLSRPNLADPLEDPSDKDGTSDKWTRGPQRTKSLKKSNMADPLEDHSDTINTSVQWAQGPSRENSLRRSTMTEKPDGHSARTSTPEHDQKDQYMGNGQENFDLEDETPPSPAKVKKRDHSGSRARASQRKIPEEMVKTKPRQEDIETALDIRTDLKRSTDILGKLVSRASLEWKSPEIHSEEARVMTYAGKLLSLKRMRKVEGHLSSVTCVYFDSRRLVTCGLDRVVRMWDVRSGRSLHKFLGHKGGVRCVQFDNDLLATGSWDCLIMIWSMRTLENLAILRGHDDSVTCLEFNTEILVSGSCDNTARVWMRPTFYCTRVVRFDSAILSLVLCGPTTFAVTTSSLRTELVEALSGSKRLTFETPLGPVSSLAVHGRLMLGADGEGRVFFWNVGTGDMEAAVEVHRAAIHRVTYHAGRFYTASSDSSIQEWDLKTMTCLRVLKGHTRAVRDVKVSDRRIVSCGDDGAARIWDLGSGRQ